nr:MAG TPA: hypothetical protein [Caudoviricetes sp.]
MNGLLWGGEVNPTRCLLRQILVFYSSCTRLVAEYMFLWDGASYFELSYAYVHLSYNAVPSPSLWLPCAYSSYRRA